jgi:hypothetical protein
MLIMIKIPLLQQLKKCYHCPMPVWHALNKEETTPGTDI